MDKNTNLILANAVKAENWEDREKSTDDVNILREEFRKRLYPRPAGQASPQNTESNATDKS